VKKEEESLENKEDRERTNRLRALSIINTVESNPDTSGFEKVAFKVAKAFLDVTTELYLSRREAKLAKECHERVQALIQPLMVENHALETKSRMLKTLVESGETKRPINAIECLKRENDVLRSQINELQDELEERNSRPEVPGGVQETL